MMMHRKHVAHDFELNLTPIIDCFVTLICFLLLSATYVNLVGLDAKVPIAVPASSAKADTEPKFKLELLVKSNGLELTASGAGDASGKRFIANAKGSPDLASLHAALLKVKNARPKEYSIHFTSEVEMDYERLVRFMDATRNLGPNDGVFAFTDERNGKVMKADTLFPDFVIANLGATQGKK